MCKENEFFLWYFQTPHLCKLFILRFCLLYRTYVFKFQASEYQSIISNNSEDATTVIKITKFLFNFIYLSKYNFKCVSKTTHVLIHAY